MSNILDNAITQTLHFGKPTAKDAFHIALTGTPDYIPHMGIVALTVHEHNKDLPICYHFFINHLPEEEKANLQKAAASMDSPLEVHLIDDSCFKPLLLSDGVAAFFYRFLVAPTIAPVADRVLYLDGDMLCRGSLKYLSELDFQGNAVAVVSDRGEQANAKRMHTARYFNAGMMLINTRLWMKENLFDDIVRRAEENVKRVGNRLSHHDQDIHNEMLDGKSLYTQAASFQLSSPMCCQPGNSVNTSRPRRSHSSRKYWLWG